MKSEFRAFMKVVNIKNLLSGDKSIQAKIENAGLSELAEMSKLVSCPPNEEVRVTISWGKE